MKDVALFFTSGLIGSVLFFGLYRLVARFCLHWEHGTSITWLVSYAVSIVFQHKLHRVIVYGHGTPYWSSLALTFGSYSFAMVLSTAINTYLVDSMHMDTGAAWALTILSTGVLNYFLMNAILKDRKPAPAKD